MVYSAQSELLGTLATAKSMELQYTIRSDVRSPQHLTPPNLHCQS